MSNKQAKYNQDCVFRATFNDEQTCRRNGGLPTDVVFRRGNAEFNGTSSYLIYSKPFNGTYSVRIKLNISESNIYYLLDTRGISVTGIGRIYIVNEVLYPSTGISYVNGTASSSIAINKDIEIVITGITLGGIDLLLGATRHSVSYKLNGNISLFEIYKGTLTPSQVRNMYNNVTYVPLSSENDIVSLDARLGIIEETTGKTVINTNVTLPKISQYRAMKFNGSDSMLDLGDVDLLGGISVFGWIKLKSWGESLTYGLGTLIDNGAFFLATRLDTESLLCASDSSTWRTSLTNSLSLNKEYFVGVTRTAAGLVNFYIGNKDTAPTLSGTANQNSGIPIAGTTNLIAGNNAAGTRSLDGTMPLLNIKSGIMSLDLFAQAWSSTKNKI